MVYNKLLTDDILRRNYIEKGKKWVEHFTWDRTARKTLEVYEEIRKKRSGIERYMSGKNQFTCLPSLFSSLLIK